MKEKDKEGIGILLGATLLTCLINIPIGLLILASFKGWIAIENVSIYGFACFGWGMLVILGMIFFCNRDLFINEVEDDNQI